MEKYSFRPHKIKFLDLFRKEKIKLKKILAKDAKIEHIGSTAVPKLRGKGIIDIIISVKKSDLKSSTNKLEKNNYKLSTGGDKDRIFFVRDYKFKGKTRRVHLHLTTHNSKTWKESIAVRDYLRQHLEEAKRYENIKKEGVKIAKGEGKKYRKYKHEFLQKIIRKASGLKNKDKCL